ncbi:type II secretion system F family protein [Aurantimicrobium minutum]|uniref:type II secretion system F family protein n=1 Tax=Aurantimicrobium minutum TaxID=708131 RepID=UPI002473275B|nr:type II secretion system F family protein [Aurantimicrobium minutum]MDH6423855.1 tight adherence protein C [Aurantimicrobium minutum]
MSSLAGWGIGLGALFGLGVWIILTTLPSFRSASLPKRVAHMVADISPQAYADVTEKSSAPLPQFDFGIRGLKNSLLAITERFAGPADAVELDLARAGSEFSVTEFRARQITWGLWGAAAGLLVDGAVSVLTQPAALAYVLVPVMGALVGYLSVRYFLGYAAKSRVKRIEAQLPAVWEFLSLSLSAGEGLPDALRRMATIGHGDITDEFRVVVLDVQMGIPMATALQTLERKLKISALSRGIEQILGGLNRGTPVSAVLQAHALDAREDSKRRLLESAGQKEVAMLVPLVFLILPVTIVFAVFPGLLVIQSGF